MSVYSNTHTFQTALDGGTVKFISKPGLPAWDTVTPSARLLAEQSTLSSSDRVLFLGCGHGAAAIPLARRLTRGEMWLHDPNLIALRCAQQTLEENRIHNVSLSYAIEPNPEQEDHIDTLLIDLPKGRKLGRRWLLQAYLLLRPGGKLYLAGSKEMGIVSLIKDGQELFNNVGILGYKKGARLAYFVKNPESTPTAPAWRAEPGIAPHTWSISSLEFGGQSYVIHSLPGVFSYDGLDTGTHLLLQHAPKPKGPRILDLGCGSGIIGMVMAKQAKQEGWQPYILMIDSNLLAVACAEQNILANHIIGARVEAGDLLEGRQGDQFDLILTNPPFHAGHEVDYAVTEALIHQSHAALAAGGELVLVANRFIRYNLLIERVFSHSRSLYQDNRFHILAATK